jgi:DNA helicase-2/ATP-dependent DNA helicase PcrA
VDRNKVVGRYDLVLEAAGHVTIVDFKTGDVQTEKKASERAKESLQLDVYALAWQRTAGRMPDRVELRFLESGVFAGRAPVPEDLEEAESRIRAAAEGIRRREFPARPTWTACGQCPFREICPYTARAPEGV